MIAMFKFIKAYSKEDVKQAVIAIGQELIKRSDDICSDLERVKSIDITTTITADDEVMLSVTKNYTVVFDEENNKGRKK